MCGAEIWSGTVGKVGAHTALCSGYRVLLEYCYGTNMVLGSSPPNHSVGPACIPRAAQPGGQTTLERGSLLPGPPSLGSRVCSTPFAQHPCWGKSSFRGCTHLQSSLSPGPSMRTRECTAPNLTASSLFPALLTTRLDSARAADCRVLLLGLCAGAWGCGGVWWGALGWVQRGAVRWGGRSLPPGNAAPSTHTGSHDRNAAQAATCPPPAPPAPTCILSRPPQHPTPALAPGSRTCSSATRGGMAPPSAMRFRQAGSRARWRKAVATTARSTGCRLPLPLPPHAPLPGLPPPCRQERKKGRTGDGGRVMMG